MKVGDYVRTDKGISKIYMVYKQFILITTNYKQVMNEDIIKSSPNIIDLIEVGDYVNGIKVDFVCPPLKVFLDGEEYLEDEIKSIVTKEQFSQMEYKVESEVN